MIKFRYFSFFKNYLIIRTNTIINKKIKKFSKNLKPLSLYREKFFSKEARRNKKKIDFKLLLLLLLLYGYIYIRRLLVFFFQ